MNRDSPNYLMRCLKAMSGRAGWRNSVLGAVVLVTVAAGVLAGQFVADGDARLLAGQLAAGQGQGQGKSPVVDAAPDKTQMVEDVVLEHFRTFALNAFLVTLMDDSVTLHWTDVALQQNCGPLTRVDIDDKPMVSGASVPATAFTVRWTMDQCWPMEAAFAASGVLELAVFHEDNGMSAVVNAGQTKINGVNDIRLQGALFPATMSLATRVEQR